MPERITQEVADRAAAKLQAFLDSLDADERVVIEAALQAAAGDEVSGFAMGDRRTTIPVHVYDPSGGDAGANELVLNVLLAEPA